MSRTKVVLSMVVVSAVLGTSAPAQPREVGGIGLTVFENRNYGGDNATFLRDEPTLAASRMDRRISSLRVGPGEFWEVCDEQHFRGRCQVFSGAESDLRRVSWDNRIRSARRVQAGGGLPPTFPPGGGGAPPGGLLFFSGPSYSGRQQVITSSIADFRRLSFDNQAQSVRVGGGVWEVCEDRNFRKCRTVSGDVANLSMLGLSRRISSARPARAGGGPQVPGQIQLFDQPGFRGRSQQFATAVAASTGLVNGQAESVRIRGGAWQVCEREGFQGACTVLATDLADLNSIGWGNRIRSMRPAQ